MEEKNKYKVIIDVDGITDTYIITEDEATNKDWNEIINELVEDAKKIKE